MNGRHTNGASPKISYTTEEKARSAARRLREERCVAARIYRCREVIDPEHFHPALRAEHWHITTKPLVTRETTPGYRFHEEWGDVLGMRVAGTMWAENGKSKRDRRSVIRQRVEAVDRRRKRTALSAPASTSSDQ